MLLETRKAALSATEDGQRNEHSASRNFIISLDRAFFDYLGPALISLAIQFGVAVVAAVNR